MKKNILYSLIASSILLPALVFAQTTSTSCPTAGSGQQALCTVINTAIGYMNQGLFLLMGLAILMFVWYVIKYFLKPDANRAEAGSYVMYSVIGFFIILSFWGIVNIVQNTFGLQNQTAPQWGSFNSLFPSSGGVSSNPYFGNGNTTFTPNYSIQ